MDTVTIRGVELGSGIPKIVVPIVEATQEGILNKAWEIVSLPVEMVEWRGDFYRDVLCPDRLLETLGKLRAALGGLPVIFTLRTRHDGGELDVSFEQYKAINEDAAASGCADVIDVEIYRGAQALQDHIDAIHSIGVRVIGSFHDFRSTPSRQEMVSRLRQAQDMGSDISKIAVMPRCQRDVLALLDASVEMREQYAERPIVAISMGPMGVVSRIACEATGSCMTFGAAGKASAPGQIQVEDLRHTLDVLHLAQFGSPPCCGTP